MFDSNSSQNKSISTKKVQLEIGRCQLVRHQVLAPAYHLKMGGVTSSTPMRLFLLMQTTYRTHWSFGIARTHAKQLLEVPRQQRHQITNLKLGCPPARWDGSNDIWVCMVLRCCCRDMGLASWMIAGGVLWSKCVTANYFANSNNPHNADWYNFT
jgi:hypothetical protein